MLADYLLWALILPFAKCGYVGNSYNVTELEGEVKEVFVKAYPELANQLVARADTPPAGFESMAEYNQVQKVFHAADNIYGVVGWIGGNWGPIWSSIVTCAKADGSEFNKLDVCMNSVGAEAGYAVGAFVGSNFAGSKLPALGIAMVRGYNHWTSYSSKTDAAKANKQAGKGNENDGFDELFVGRNSSRRAAPDSCSWDAQEALTIEFASQPGNYSINGATIKATMATYCAFEDDSEIYDAAIYAASVFGSSPAQSAVRYTYTVYRLDTKQVAARTVVDLIQPYFNHAECPADIPGDGDGCACLAADC